MNCGSQKFFFFFFPSFEFAAIQFVGLQFHRENALHQINVMYYPAGNGTKCPVSRYGIF